MSQPSKLPEWADSSTNVVEPSSGRKLQGFDIGQTPSSGNQNWWQNNVYQWVSWIKNALGPQHNDDGTHKAITAPSIRVGEGTTGTGGYAFTESSNDTGMFSLADGDMGLYSNGTRKASLQTANSSRLTAAGVVSTLNVAHPASQLDLASVSQRNIAMAWGAIQYTTAVGGSYTGFSQLYNMQLSSAANVLANAYFDITFDQALLANTIPCVTVTNNFPPNSGNAAYPGIPTATGVRIFVNGSLGQTICVTVFGQPATAPAAP